MNQAEMNFDELFPVLFL